MKKKTLSNLDNLLSQLKEVVLSTSFSRERALAILEYLLEWLNKPENNTDENCKAIDYYVSYEIMFKKDIQSLPEDIENILFDMGATLHDAHTAPDIAENFESLPRQLLERVRKLK